MKLDDDFDYEFDYEDNHGKMNMGAAVIVVSIFIFQNHPQDGLFAMQFSFL